MHRSDQVTDLEALRYQVVGDLFDVRGLGVVVTGGGSGLGLSIGTVLAQAGAVVTLADVNRERLEQAAAALADDGLEVHTSELDVTDGVAVDRVLQQAAAREFGLQIVFANAGISAGSGPWVPEGRLTEIDPAKWQRVLDTNLTGVLNTIQAAAKHIAPGYGRIIVTSSVAGIRADPLVGYAYAATKAAVVGLVRNAALELAGAGILVNAIAPGFFTTNIGEGNAGRAGIVDEFIRASALRRSADPSEIQGLALFLASPASSYVTGAVLSIDGGASTARTVIT